MKNRFVKAITLAAALLLPSLTEAQSPPSNPAMTYGEQPTVGQWIKWFQDKQDTLNFNPLNQAGDSMLGELKIIASSLAKAGLNLRIGVAPSLPQDGDVWFTTLGMYIQVNGTTVGPLSGATAASFTAAFPLTVNFSGGTVTYSWATGWRAVADTAYPVVQNDRFVCYTSISAARNVTLLAASSYAAGTMIEIGDCSSSASGTNTISVVPNGADQIDNSNTTQVAVNSSWGRTALVSDGVSKWSVRQASITGDVTCSGFFGVSFNCPINAAAVTLAKMANLAANSIIGNNTGSSATPIALTQAQLTAMLNVFTSTLSGAVPSSGGGTVNYLRADGTFAVPPGTNAGTVTSVTCYGAAITASGTCTTIGQAPGIASNAAASAGNVGEYISNNVASPGVSLTTSTAKDVGTVSLTAGDWDCQGNVWLDPAGTTNMTAFYAWISTTANTFPTQPNSGAMVGIAAGTGVYATGAQQGLATGRLRVLINSTTTISLGIEAVFSVSTATGYGFIGCRRMR